MMKKKKEKKMKNILYKKRKYSKATEIQYEVGLSVELLSQHSFLWLQIIVRQNERESEKNKNESETYNEILVKSIFQLSSAFG